MNPAITKWLDDVHKDPLPLILVVAVVAVALAISFLPTLVAIRRQHRNRLAIFVLNVTLGWTFVGWAIALVWACANSAENRSDLSVVPLEPDHVQYTLVSVSDKNYSKTTYGRPGIAVTTAGADVGDFMMIGEIGVPWACVLVAPFFSLMALFIDENVNVYVRILVSVIILLGSVVIAVRRIPGWIEFEAKSVGIYESPFGKPWIIVFWGKRSEEKQFVSYSENPPRVYFALAENRIVEIRVGEGYGQPIAEAISSHVARIENAR